MSSVTTPRVVPGPPVVILRVLLAVIFAGAGVAKLSGAAAMVSLFESIAVGQWLRFVVGAVELGGALLLLRPSLAGLGALFLAVVMVGAIAAEVLVIGASPIIPLVVLVLLGFLAWEYRAETARYLTRLRGAFTR
jgi:hypothetical protein